MQRDVAPVISRTSSSQVPSPHLIALMHPVSSSIVCLNSSIVVALFVFSARCATAFQTYFAEFLLTILAPVHSDPVTQQIPFHSYHDERERLAPFQYLLVQFQFERDNLSSRSH